MLKRRSRMKLTRSRRGWAVPAALAVVLLLSPPGGPAQSRAGSPELAALVPRFEGWAPSEAPRSYFPESLFEYINGAAESYLSYDFQELLVLDLEKKGTEATLTFEIYDMGSPVNAFGAKVAAAVKEKGAPPALVLAFPRHNLVAQSEKYIKKNFMGYEFLRNGFVATYKVGGKEFEGFFVEGESEKDAEAMLGKLIEALARDKQTPERIALDYHSRNRYGPHLYICPAR